MKEAWFTPKELTRMEGMPRTIQGVHKKAKREGWLSRRKLGTQGPAVEYCLSPEPLSVGMGSALLAHASEEGRASLENTDVSKRRALQNLWLLVFHQLTDEQVDHLLSFFLHEGMMGLLETYRSVETKKLAAMIAMLSPSQKAVMVSQLEELQKSEPTSKA